ncbi:THUMPD3 [Symbiodinium natans]|uniref:THUMPD3 protein n=1 Tax=Symbiodinium natans TaxID=878477 RepID=A0A812KXF4_9DINO|nr:THUMPD3 [Symbiodinium natans]
MFTGQPRFGTLEGNEALYPAVLAEMSRVLRPGGLAVLLTSQENREVLQAALSTSPLGGAWSAVHRRSFRLFVKTDACIYLLRRTPAPPAPPGEAVESTGAALAELQRAKGWGSRAQNGYRLAGAAGAFAWEDGSPWHEQWARERPALVPFGRKGARAQPRSQAAKRE